MSMYPALSAVARCYVLGAKIEKPRLLQDGNIIVAVCFKLAVRKMVIEGSNQAEGAEFDMMVEKG